MKTSILIFTDFSCDAEGLLERAIDSIVEYVGKRGLDEKPIPTIPLVKLNYSPSPEERVEIVELTNKEKQYVLFLDGELESTGMTVGKIHA